MIEGITILSQSADYSLKILGIVYMVLLSALIISATMFSVICIKDRIYKELIKSSIVLIIGILGLVFLAIPTFKAGFITQYKVILSEEVKLKEFNEKYQVINQDGEIYTIVEKEEE